MPENLSQYSNTQTPTQPQSLISKFQSEEQGKISEPKKSHRKIIFLVLIIVIGGIIALLFALTLFVNSFNEKIPQEAKDTANTIPKYPNSNNWKLVNVSPNCLFAFDGCWGAGVAITFSSSDSRETEDSYYKQELGKLGWEIDNSMGGSGVLPFKKSGTDCGIYLHSNPDIVSPNYSMMVRCGNDR